MRISFKGAESTLEKFDSKIRNQIRKGLKCCEVLNPSLRDLIEEGYYINTKIMLRHQRTVSFLHTYDIWSKYITYKHYDDNVYIRGAYVNGKLIVYTVFIKVLDKLKKAMLFKGEECSRVIIINPFLRVIVNESIGICLILLENRTYKSCAFREI